MSYYLLDHPPVRTQFYPSRANALTGGVAVHTTESIMDTVGIDTGAENVAGFIRGRKDPGSYHVLVDSDSVVHMAPDHFTTFHIAASGHNSRTWGIAFACRTTDLNPDHWWTQAAFRRAAAEIVAFWRRNGFDPAACIRWVPEGRTLYDAGLFHHGTAQPRDRTDAFTRHPRRHDLAELLTAEIKAVVSGAKPQEVQTMAMTANALTDANGNVVRPIVNGRLEEFDVLWTRVIHRWQLTPNGAWSDWDPFPPLPNGQWASDVTADRNEDGRLEAVAKTPSGKRFRIWQEKPGGIFRTRPHLPPDHPDQWVPA